MVNSSSTVGSEGGCPYASPPVYNNDDDHTSVSSNNEEVGQAIELAKTACPAFANRSCPFSKSEDIQKTIASMPPSHVSIPAVTSHCVRLALQHVNAISSTTSTDEKYEIPFQLLDGLSFNAVISKLITQHKEQTEERKEEQQPKEDPSKEEEEKLSLKANEKKELQSSSSNKEQSADVIERVSLSSALKLGTTESHSAAESVHFVKNFARGKIDRDLFACLSSNLLFVYISLERLLEEHAPTHFPSLHFPKELERTEVLRDDVEFFLGETDQLQPSPATKDYIERMEHVAKTEPLLLLSHAYTRYLGDLSGGRILSRVARKALHLDKDGLRFYHFDNIANIKQFKDNYRLQLDGLTHVNTPQMERVVAEANVAFVLNMRMFEELDMQSGDVPDASVRPLSEATKYYDRCIQQQQQPQSPDHIPFQSSVSDSNKCPFANLGGPNPHPAPKTKTKNDEETARCPWPIVFLHDPVTGMKDYQTWVLVGILLSFAWSMLLQHSS